MKSNFAKSKLKSFNFTNTFFVKILVIITVFFTLVSCSAKEKDHLAYQSYPIKAECVLSIMEEEYPFTLGIPSPGNARITFTGSRLEGGVLGISKSEVFFLNGEYTFPLIADERSPLQTLVSAFSLDSADMTEVETTDTGLRVCYKQGNGNISVTLENEKPVLMEFAGDAGVFTLKLNEFTSGT